MGYLPRPNGSAARFAAMVALLVKKPRTEREIQIALEWTDYRAPKAHLQLLRDEGLVYILSWRKRRNAKPIATYAWQPSVAECTDAPEPVVARRRSVVQNRSSDQLNRSAAP